MRFAHISDIHFKTHGSDATARRVNVREAISRVISDLASIDDYLDFVSITGDLTEDGEVEAYAGLKSLLGGLKTRIFVVPGNHDRRDAFRQAFLAVENVADSETFDYQATLGNVQVVGLDTVVPGEPTGRLSERQLAWLAPILQARGFTHTVVSMHHPPFLTGFSGFDETIQLEGRDAFGEIVQGARSKIILLCGHIHRPFQAQWMGANCYISGGPSFQLGSPRPFGVGAQRLVEEPYAYFVHSIDDQGDHVVSTRYVNLNRETPGDG